MGKGYSNFMGKKDFHPGSQANLKRVFVAQQKAAADQKKQEELKAQYEREQDLFINKSLVSKESKDKLSVNFLYEPPPGLKKKEDNAGDYKFEWQRKYNAPREDYCRGNEEIRDQPLAIAVRNVKCLKCQKWGHLNIDRECPLLNQNTYSGETLKALDRGSSMTRIGSSIPMLSSSKLAIQKPSVRYKDRDTQGGYQEGKKMYWRS